MDPSRRIRTGAVLALIALVGAASPASASTPARISGPTPAQPVATIKSKDRYAFTDGRFVAFGNLIYDTLRDRKRRLAGCYVNGAAPSHFLVWCRTGQSFPVAGRYGFYLARARRLVPIRGAGSDGFTRMGRNWLLGNNSEPEAHTAHWVWLNWLTGERYDCDVIDGDPECDDFLWDLDSPRRARLPANQIASTPAYSVRLRQINPPYGERHTLRLWREGRPGPILARALRCRSARECSVTLDERAVTWGVSARDGRSAVVRAYALDSQSHVRWGVRMSGAQFGLHSIHTRYGVVILAAASRGDGATGPWYAYFVPWPRGWR